MVRDRASSYIWVKRFLLEPLVNMTAHLTQIFNANGSCDSIRSDGGPTYRKGFKKFLRAAGISHELEAAYASSSNGNIENAIKLVKSILVKTQARTDLKIQVVLANFNALSRSDGASPASLLPTSSEGSWHICCLPSILGPQGGKDEGPEEAGRG